MIGVASVTIPFNPSLFNRTSKTHSMSKKVANSLNLQNTAYLKKILSAAIDALFIETLLDLPKNRSLDELN